ncbi:MAG: MFS transporter [Candidatus Hodarchaeota archaeon]
MSENESKTILSSRVPRHHIWGILVGFSLFHISQSIFWQFGSLYLFTGIGETAFLLIGLVGGLPVLVGLAGVYFWGVLSDRWQRRIPFIAVGFIAQGVAFFLYIFIQDSLSFLLVTCAAYLFSVAAVPMANAYLTEARIYKGGSVGLLLSTSSLGWSVGAFGGGFLISLIQMSGLFFVGCIAYLTGVTIILLIVREVPRNTNSESNEEAFKNPDSTTGPTLILSRSLIILAVTVAIGSIGVNAFSFFFGIYFVEEIAGTTLMLGISNGFAALVGLGFTLLAGFGSDRFGRKPIILLGFAGYAVFMIVYLFVIDPWIAMVLWIIPLYPLVYTASYAAAADLSVVSKRGRAMAIIATANLLGSGIGPIIGGTLVQFVLSTLRGNMIFATSLNILAFLAVLLLVPETLQASKTR